MLDITALFELSYGIYIITAHSGEHHGGCLVNTVFQVTAEPVRIAVSVSKQNETYELIEKSRTLAVNVMGESAESGLLGRFGYRSGREFDKFAGVNFTCDENGDAVLKEPGVIARLSCRVCGSVDVDTHTIFLCEVTDAQKLKDETPMTYNYFRDVKKLKASKHAPTYHA